MGMTNNFVRGGQLSLHKYQMIKQVSFVSIFVCFLVYVLAVGILFFKNTDSNERSLYWEYVTAESNVAFQFGDPSLANEILKKVYKAHYNKNLSIKIIENLKGPFQILVKRTEKTVKNY